TVYYTEDVVEPTTYTLTIQYVYGFGGGTAAPMYTAVLEEGASYSVTSPKISGYSTAMKVVSGTITGPTAHTVYYYANAVTQYTLTIYYKYADGTTAAPTYSKTMDKDSAYSVTSPTIEDYVADKTVVSGTLSGNKSVTVTYSARTPDVSFEADGGSGNYTAGTSVISSFTVKNGAYNIKPFMNCDIAFRAYYIENSTQRTVATDTWDNFVIPKNEEGLVYFMWDVPESLAGKTVYCEISYGSQKTSFSKTVKAKTESQVPNTRYETEKPSGFTSKNAGSASRGSAEWEIWEYEGGSYEKVKYTLSISADVEIKPDSNSFSAVYENGKWTMRSGYGYTISVKMNVSATSGADYTKGQCASAYLPEYEYSKTKNEYCTLELVDDTFQFATNTASAESARIVFMPVWYPDGGYTLKVVITDVWTPTGVVSVTGISNTITVSGTVFDDFYVGA
ncbi:MAG: MucBP domain-containing protein, partial [Clostridia bacterium]|nr:MucBP domain-containing protein [Clostridia bacterium]